MKGILADYNIAGQVRALVETFYASKEWSDFWNSLGLSSHVFADVGLDKRAPDDVVWQMCQDTGLVLITGNRNASRLRWRRQSAIASVRTVSPSSRSPNRNRSV